MILNTEAFKIKYGITRAICLPWVINKINEKKSE